MLIEALGFAFLAGLNTTALLIGAVYLGSASPRKMVLFYLLGAVFMTAVMGTALFLIIRAGGLNQVSERTPRYGLRLGPGVLALIAGIIVARRDPRPGPRRPTAPARSRDG